MKIVWLSEIKWRTLLTRKQQILNRLPKNWKILYVEPFHMAEKNQLLPVYETENIITVTVPLPHEYKYNKLLKIIGKHKILIKLIHKITLLWLSCIRFILGFRKDAIVIISEPRFLQLISGIRSKLLVYDYNDNHFEAHDTNEAIKEYQNDLIKIFDLIITSSSQKFDELSKINYRKVHFIGNGVDYDLFQKQLKAIDIPGDIKSIPQPRIGYLGAIASWFDFDLLTYIAMKRPQYSFVLVGPIEPNIDKEVMKLKSIKNIYFLGKKEYDLVPQYINNFDVGLIPFNVTKFTNYVNPDKLYEYMALGKPVVATPFSVDVLKFEKNIYIRKSFKEFLFSIDTALTEFKWSTELRIIAKKNSWKNKAQSFVNIITDNYMKSNQ